MVSTDDLLHDATLENYSYIKLVIVSISQFNQQKFGYIVNEFNTISNSIPRINIVNSNVNNSPSPVYFRSPNKNAHLHINAIPLYNKQYNTCTTSDTANEHGLYPTEYIDKQVSYICSSMLHMRHDGYEELYVHKKIMSVICMIDASQYNNAQQIQQQYSVYTQIKGVLSNTPNQPLRYQCFIFDQHTDILSTQLLLNATDIAYISTSEIQQMRQSLTSNITVLCSTLLNDFDGIIRRLQPHAWLITPYDTDISKLNNSKSTNNNNLARQYKYIGDLCMLAACPKDAKKLYKQSMDILRSVNDPIWYCGAYESYAAALLATQFERSIFGSTDVVSEILTAYECILGQYSILSNISLLELESLFRLIHYLLQLDTDKLVEINHLLSICYDIVQTKLGSINQIACYNQLYNVCIKIRFYKKAMYYKLQLANLYLQLSHFQQCYIVLYDIAHSYGICLCKYHVLKAVKQPEPIPNGDQSSVNGSAHSKSIDTQCNQLVDCRFVELRYSVLTDIQICSKQMELYHITVATAIECLLITPCSLTHDQQQQCIDTIRKYSSHCTSSNCIDITPSNILSDICIIDTQINNDVVPISSCRSPQAVFTHLPDKTIQRRRMSQINTQPVIKYNCSDNDNIINLEFQFYNKWEVAIELSDIVLHCTSSELLHATTSNDTTIILQSQQTMSYTRPYQITTECIIDSVQCSLYNINVQLQCNKLIQIKVER